MPQATVIPVLPYPHTGDAVVWLCKAFGFTVRLRIAKHRAQLNVADGAIIVRSGLGPSHSVMVRVEDVDAHCRHACENGARVTSPLTDYPYGERQYTVEDFAGHDWTFSQTLADVDPPEWPPEWGGVTQR